MKLSSRSEYGMRALAVLARHFGETPLSIRTIASAEGISEQFLEQIFVDLRRAGLVESVRGARGGFRLSRKPGEISVGDAYRALEGPIAPTDCLSDDPETCCTRTDHCAARTVWQRLRDSMAETLDGMTLADLAASARGEEVGEDVETAKEE